MEPRKMECYGLCSACVCSITFTNKDGIEDPFHLVCKSLSVDTQKPIKILEYSAESLGKPPLTATIMWTYLQNLHMKNMQHYTLLPP